MEHNIDNNKIIDNDEQFQELQFEYNFINTPWDDRSRKSKIGIVALLVAIFIATMACVINNFVTHYKNYDSNRNISNVEINCYRVKVEDYPFVARIHSASTKNLLCVGAVVSDTSVLASGVCAQSGAIKVHLGSQTDSHCKKGFPVNIIEPVYRGGVVSKGLVLLSSYENMSACCESITVGTNLDWEAQLNIIGRPLRIGHSLSQQHVTLADKRYVGSAKKYLNKENMVCVKDLARCPVQAGDLLVQKRRLFGLAASSVLRTERNQLACFANLSIITHVLKELFANIKVDRNESQRLGEL